MDRWVSRLNPRFLVRSITDYAVPEAGFSTLYLKDVSILCMDEMGFKTQPEFLARSVPGNAVPEAGFSTFHLEDISIPFMDEVSLKDLTHGFWLGPLLIMLYLRLASAWYTWRTNPSSVWTRWVSRLNLRFLARSITDYAFSLANFSTVYLEDVPILTLDEVGFKIQPEVSG